MPKSNEPNRRSRKDLRKKKERLRKRRKKKNFQVSISFVIEIELPDDTNNNISADIINNTTHMQNNTMHSDMNLKKQKGKANNLKNKKVDDLYVEEGPGGIGGVNLDDYDSPQKKGYKGSAEKLKPSNKKGTKATTKGMSSDDKSGTSESDKHKGPILDR